MPTWMKGMLILQYLMSSMLGGATYEGVKKLGGKCILCDYGHLTGVYSSVVDRCMYPLYSKYICTTLLLFLYLNFSFHVCQVRFR
jgi:hypothetical protein